MEHKRGARRSPSPPRKAARREHVPRFGDVTICRASLSNLQRPLHDRISFVGTGLLIGDDGSLSEDIEALAAENDDGDAGDGGDDAFGDDVSGEEGDWDGEVGNEGSESGDEEEEDDEESGGDGSEDEWAGLSGDEGKDGEGDELEGDGEDDDDNDDQYAGSKIGSMLSQGPDTPGVSSTAARSWAMKKMAERLGCSIDNALDHNMQPKQADGTLGWKVKDPIHWTKALLSALVKVVWLNVGMPEINRRLREKVEERMKSEGKDGWRHWAVRVEEVYEVLDEAIAAGAKKLEFD